MKALIVAAGLLSISCARDPVRPVELRVEPGQGSTSIRLLPGPGWKINALLPPAFERADGSIIRLGTDTLSPDSAYYLAPPTATLPGFRGPLRGTLRASVCAVGQQVCRSYVEQFGS